MDTTDKLTIEGKDYDGWYCKNKTEFLAVMPVGGTTKMFHLDGRTPCSMNPVTDLSQLDSHGKKLHKGA